MSLDARLRKLTIAQFACFTVPILAQLLRFAHISGDVGQQRLFTILRMALTILALVAVAALEWRKQVIRDAAMKRKSAAPDWEV